MKDFTMSMYKNKEDLYKAKAEYYETKCEELINSLKAIVNYQLPTYYDVYYKGEFGYVSTDVSSKVTNPLKRLAMDSIANYSNE